MKSYLSLVPISAKVRKRQNRMTILCVIISIFLVTAIFSVADMMIRTQSDRMTGKNGSWHIELDGISQETALKIAERDDVVSIGAVTIFNPDGELPYRMDGKRVVLYGIDESYLTMNSTGAAEGRFPQGMGEIMLSSNAARVLQVAVGDTVTLRTPSGDWDFTVSGLGGVEESYYSGQYSLMDAYLPRTAFAALMEQNNVHNLQTSYYVQFTSASKAAKAIPELTAQHNLPENAVSENTGVMAIAGQSDSSAAKNVYSLAAVLFVLVLLAGVLMISGSMNSNLAQRIQFFGMMRCIGMSKQQIIRFVRLEALNWCRTAIPIGVLLGILVTWILCAVLRFGVGGEFADITLFGVSLIGILSGVIVGVVTVLIAAGAPAKRAAKVSPITAVSGAAENENVQRCAVNSRFYKIETALGIQHAISVKKNLILMTGSFALSIILFLSFSVLIEFIGHVMPQFSNTPDFSISGADNSNTLDDSLVDEISKINGVKRVYGRRSSFNVPVKMNQDEGQVDVVDLISYDAFDLECLVKDKQLQKGSDISKVYGDSKYVLAICDVGSSLKTGTVIQMGSEELEIAGILKYNPFSDDGSTNGEVILITSTETFIRLTGESDYSLIMIQAKTDMTDEDVTAISSLLNDTWVFRDKREQRTTSLYLAFMLFVYGFLAIITLVTVLNIMNSISMSVSARIKQYGAMRAVGMDERQLTKMIAAEAFTYALAGCVVGCVIGLLISKLLYDSLITTHYSYAIWSIPVGSLIFIILFIAAAAILAVYAPSRRIRHTSVTETINEL